MIKIDKGIPIPELKRTKYPFDLMNIGDSFFAPKPNLTASIQCAHARTGFKFTSKFENGGTRVWRVE